MNLPGAWRFRPGLAWAGHAVLDTRRRMLPHHLHPRRFSVGIGPRQPDEGNPDRHRHRNRAGRGRLADRPTARALEDPPARPDHAADAIDVAEAEIGPVGISGI